MLDKKKLIAIAVIGGAVVVALTVFITLSLSGHSSKQPSAEQGTSASSSAKPTAVEAVKLTSDEKQLVMDAASTAASFDTNPEFALKPADYVKAGFTETLSKTYKPIWAGLFAGRTDQQGARINAGALSFLYSPDALKVLDYSGPKPGNYVIRVAVKVQWAPWSVHFAPGKSLDWKSATTLTDVGLATWTLTYEQLSGRILKVEQPAWQDLGAEPLFDAMGLPVPTKEAKGDGK